MDYFAYGSNMLRERLEARVGGVVVIGVAELRDHTHAFNKFGRDGTGKGNIVAAPGRVVYGVLYRITREQLDCLRVYEGGYEQVSLTVLRAQRAISAISFRAIRPVEPLRPDPQYVTFYERGMREHDLPDDYRDFVLGQARSLLRGR